MIEAWGVVTAVDGENATVRMEDSGCGRCHEPGGCGGNNISQMFCTTPRSYRVRVVAGIMVGKRVQLLVSDGAVRHGANLVYAMPLLVLLAGALAGSALAGEAGALAGTLAGIIAAFGFLRWKNAHGKRNDHFEPRIKA